MIEQVNSTYAGNFRCWGFQCRSKAMFVFLMLLMLSLLPGFAAAQKRTAESKGGGEHRYQGTFTINLQRHMVTDPRTHTSLPIAEVKVQWAMWVLMGQPVKTFVANYSLQNAGMITTSGVASCLNGKVTVHKGRQTFGIQTTETEKKPPGEILSTSVFRAWFISKDPKRAALSSLLNKNHKVFIDFKPDSMVPASLGYGISAPGSPEWDQLFQRSSFGGSVYLTAAEAKEVMRRGLKLQGIELIEPHLSVSTALARHNQQVRIDCEKERKALLSKTKTNVQSDDKSPSLTGKLNALLLDVQAKSDPTTSSDPDKVGKPTDKSSSLTDKLNALLLDVQAKSDPTTSSASGKVGKLQAEDKRTKRGEDADRKPFYDKTKKKYGYMDRAGNVVIEPQFQDTRDFHYGHARVKNNGKIYLIDMTGKPVLGPFDDADNLGDYGLLAVKKFSKWSYIDLNGNTVLDGFERAYRFTNGFASVKFPGDRSTYYINREGKRIFGPFESGEGFSQGLALVNREGKREDYHFLKTDGSLMGPYSAARSFHESGFTAVARMIDRTPAWGVIDTQGKVIIPLDYHKASVRYSDTGTVELVVMVEAYSSGSCGSYVYEEYSQRFNAQGKVISGKELSHRRVGELCLRGS